MNKKDFDGFLDFQQITTYLLEADHDITVDCVYGSTSRKRQFDGYKQIVYNAILDPIKIGIECKNYNSRIPIEKVEAFKTKLKRCQMDKGIMVSFKGFQRGAIEEAKISNIDLIEFRRCTRDDFIDEQGESYVMEINLELVGIKPIFSLRFDRVQVLSPDFDKKEKPKLNLAEKVIVTPNYYGIYDQNGIYIYNLLDLFNQQLLNLGEPNEGEEIEIPINWEENKYHIIIKWEEKIIKLRLIEFTIIVNFLHTSDSMKIGSNNPNNWFIMKNIITGEKRLVFITQIIAIQNKFGITT